MRHSRLKPTATISALLTACAILVLGLMLPTTEANAAIKNIKPWQKYVNGSCSASASCSISLYSVPKKKRLEITNVSCTIVISTSGVPLYVQLRGAVNGVTTNFETLVPVATDIAFGNSYSAANDQIRFIAKARTDLSFRTGAKTNVIAFSCKAAGDLTTFK